MLNEQTIKTAQALIDAVHANDLSLWDSALADNFMAEYPSVHSLNREQARAYNQSFLNASDDIHFEIHHVIADGDWIAFVCTASSTLSRPLVTPTVTFPATGKSAKTPFVLIAHVKDGKIVAEQTVWNQLEVFQQWGLLPAG